MQRHRIPGMAVWAVIVAAAGAAAVPAAEGPRVVVLVDGGRPVADIACPVNGQSVFCLDAESGGVLTIDPNGSAAPRLAVGAVPDDGPRPLAIACIDTNTLAAVCYRSGGEWGLRSWRLRPGEPVPATETLQAVPLGTAAEAGGGVQLLVGHARNWLAVSGLPAPLQPLLRGPLARANVGRLTDRGCPDPTAAGPVVAMTADPLDQLVLFTSRRDGAAGGGVSFHDLAGRTLLELACDLPQVRDAACCRTDGTLWAVAGDSAAADRPEGLWRIDGVFEDGRQVLRPVCVARLAGPRAVACGGRSSVFVAHGDGGRTLVRVEPVAGPAAAPTASDEERRP